MPSPPRRKQQSLSITTKSQSVGFESYNGLFTVIVVLKGKTSAVRFEDVVRERRINEVKNLKDSGHQVYTVCNSSGECTPGFVTVKSSFQYGRESMNFESR